MTDFATIYEHERQRVFAYLLAHTGNWHVAEDLCADVFVVALEQYGQWQETGTPYAHYLRRVAHYLCANYWRRETRRRTFRLWTDDEQEPALVDDGGIDSLIDRCDTALQAALLRAALPKLRPRPLRALALRYGTGLPELEAGRRMGLGREAYRAVRRGAEERLQQLILGKEPRWAAKNKRTRGLAQPSSR